MRDDLLIEIARRAPTRAEDLHALRGLPRGQEEAIVEAVRRAKALPPDQCPHPETRDSDPPNIVLLGNLLSVVLNDFAGRNRIAGNLIASGSDLKALARSQAADRKLPAVPLCRGWRAKFVLPELLALLAGDTAIRVADPRLNDPLELVELEPEELEEPGADEPADAGPPKAAPPDPPAAVSEGTLEASGDVDPPEVDPR
jgi:ribonuclease D